MHQALDIATELLAAIQSFEPAVHEQMLAHGGLRIDGGELGTHSKRESCRAGMMDDRDSFDKYVSLVWNDIASYRNISISRNL